MEIPSINPNLYPLVLFLQHCSKILFLNVFLRISTNCCSFRHPMKDLAMQIYTEWKLQMQKRSKLPIQESLGVSPIKYSSWKTKCAQGSKFDKVNNIYCLIEGILVKLAIFLNCEYMVVKNTVTISSLVPLF